MDCKQIMTVEEINKCYEKVMDKIKECDQFIDLTMRKSKIAPELSQLRNIIEKEHNKITFQVDELQNNIKKANECADYYTKRLIQAESRLMQYFLNEKKQKVEKQVAEEQIIHQILNSGVKSTSKKMLPVVCVTNASPQSKKDNNHLGVITNTQYKDKPITYSMSKIIQNNGNTPKISLNDYKQSPLVKCKIRNPFMFLEFEVQLQQKHFDKIPKYMRGRETLEDLNRFLDQVIIPCFNEKYQLLHRERSSVRNLNDLELWKLFNEQVSLAPGSYFITPGDISRQIKKMMDKKMHNRLVILRQVELIKEKRISGTVCYIWNKNFN